jgi:predicted nucleotidyltransferase
MAGQEEVRVTNELLWLHKQLMPVLQRHNIQKAIVFGSFARGETSRRSDVDLILIQQTDKRFLDRYDGLLYEMSCAVPGRDLDVLIYTPEELTAMMQRRFIATILREGKVIYESK